MLDVEPKRRPTSSAIDDNINMWIEDLNDNSTELFAQIKEADKRLLSSISTPSVLKESHEAISFSPLLTENIRNIVDSDKQYSNLAIYFGPLSNENINIIDFDMQYSNPDEVGLKKDYKNTIGNCVIVISSNQGC
ncbi:21491_t:CDS:2 [Gigaspora rosea]|nr:21491_t:CDS:2 [Gigaspora rosea]